MTVASPVRLAFVQRAISGVRRITLVGDLARDRALAFGPPGAIDPQVRGDPRNSHAFGFLKMH
jgi:hypothetical protein